MIKVLIVDDDETKQRKIEAVVREHIFGEVDLVTAGDQSAAYVQLKETQFDLMILDINLPRDRSGNPVRDGGVKLLKAIERHKNFKMPHHIVGLTAYEELRDEHEALFNDAMRFLITYKGNETGWQSRLSAMVVNVVAANADSADEGYQTDLVILTALQTPELDAVLNLAADWKQISNQENDAFCFHRGEFATSEGSLSVVAGSATRMGMPAATVLTCRAIERFRPRYLGMAGIAAGVKGAFGDILVADRTWDYGSGKSKRSGRFFSRTLFEPDPHQIPTDDGLLSRVSLFRAQNPKMMETLVQNWKGTIGKVPAVKIGPVASGAAVLENRPVIDAIKRNNRKLIGIEMETYGVYLAAALAAPPKPIVFSAKAICDFGDSRKDDNMQAFAAYMSAEFVHAFALKHLHVHRTQM